MERRALRQERPGSETRGAIGPPTTLSDDPREWSSIPGLSITEPMVKTSNSISPTTPAVNDLCSLCRVLLSSDAVSNLLNIKRSVKRQMFHTLKELENCARSSCHVCYLLNEDSKHREDGLRARELLKHAPDLEMRLKALLLAEDTVSFSGNKEPELNLLLGYDNGTSNDLQLIIANVSFYFMGESIERPKTYTSSVNTDSDQSRQQVHQWSQNCSRYHQDCKPQITPKVAWPTGVLDVGTAESNVVRLLETSEIEASSIEYMALSHCWGDFQPTRLLLNNYSSFLGAIPWSDLPRTFRDAVQVTRRLERRFLWIDSLCIIQDSKDDWIKESSRMHQVYRNSFLTIAAAAAANATGGLFYSRDLLMVTPCLLEYGDGDARSYLQSTAHHGEWEGLPLLRLFQRAWAYQERILSPRLLVFAQNQIYWDCPSLLASESVPPGDFFMTTPDRMRQTRGIWRRLGQQSPELLADEWSEIITSYSGLELTHDSDKLVAVAGLAAEFFKHWPSVRYLAGIWSYRLRRGLLWVTLRGGPWKTPIYTAPSWSWASVHAMSVYQGLCGVTERSDNFATVLDARVSLLSPGSPFGMVQNGYVSLRAPLIRAMFAVSKVNASDWQWHLRPLQDDDDVADSGRLKDHGFANTFPFFHKLKVEIWLDDKAVKASSQCLIAYLMPAEASQGMYDYLHLEGLVDLPTHSKRGQFRRIGHFTLQQFWEPTPGVEHHSQTAQMEIELVRKRIRDWLDREQKAAPQEDEDPYANGIVDETLADRYEALGHLVPNIAAFLKYGAERIAMDTKPGQLDDQLFEEILPNGYSVFHIV